MWSTRKSDLEYGQEAIITNQSTYKFLVLGDASVGKTALFQTFTEEKPFRYRGKETLGCDVHVKVHNKPNEGSIKEEGAQVVYEFWELGGELKYQPFLHVYTEHQLDEFKGIFYVFDATNTKTLCTVKKQLQAIFTDFFQAKGNKSGFNLFNSEKRIPVLFVANKVDMVDFTLLPLKKAQIMKELESIFPEQPPSASDTVAYVSAADDLEQLQSLSKFIEVSLEGFGNRVYYIDKRTDLESNAKYRHIARRKAESFSSSLRSIRSYLSKKIGLVDRILLGRCRNPPEMEQKTLY